MASAPVASKFAVVVIGMHRSGTSAMARVLSLAGLSLPKRLMPPNIYNTAGYWEPQSIADLNDEMLSAQAASWHDVFPPDGTRLASELRDAFVAKARQAIAMEFEDAPAIILKDPRISVLTSIWVQALEEVGYAAKFVIMLRNPLEVADSVSARDGLSAQTAQLVWLSNSLSAERNTRGYLRALIGYDRLLTEPEAVLDQVEHELGLALPARTDAAREETRTFLNASLRHHNRPPPEDGDLHPLAAEAYGLLSCASAGAPIDTAGLDEVARKLTEHEQAMGPLIVELCAKRRALQAQVNVAEQARHAAAAALASEAALRAGLSDRTGELERELAAAGAELQAVRNEASAREDALTIARDALNSRIRALQDQLEAARREAAAREEAVRRELRAARKAAAAQAKAFSEELATLRAESTAKGRMLSRELAAAREDLTSKTAAFECELNAAREAARASEQDLQLKLQAARKETEARARAFEQETLAARQKLSAEIAGLQQKRQVQDQTIAELEDRASNAEAMLDQIAAHWTWSLVRALLPNGARARDVWKRRP